MFWKTSARYKHCGYRERGGESERDRKDGRGRERKSEKGGGGEEEEGGGAREYFEEQLAKEANRTKENSRQQQ